MRSSLFSSYLTSLLPSNCMTWNTGKKVQNDTKSIFHWSFHGFCCCQILSSLLERLSVHTILVSSIFQWHFHWFHCCQIVSSLLERLSVHTILVSYIFDWRFHWFRCCPIVSSLLERVLSVHTIFQWRLSNIMWKH